MRPWEEDCVCGIIGLLVKRNELRQSLGELVLPMFDCMAERGPDSAGPGGLHSAGEATAAPFQPVQQ